MTAITSVPSTSMFLPQPAGTGPMRQAFSQLSSALQSGDLSAAQSAYATLTQNAGANGNGPFAQALSQVGDALQSGDVDKAQQALSQLQQQMQSMRGAHHHGGHRHAAADPTQTDPSQTDPSRAAGTADPTDTAATSGTLFDVTA